MSLMMNKVVKSGGTGAAHEAAKEGKYDAVLSAIIGLERQVTYYEGKELVKPLVKVLFEIPAVTITTEDGDRPLLLAEDVTVSSSERSKLYKIISAVTHTTPTEDEMISLLNSESGLKDLLGKSCVVRVNQYDSKYGGSRNGIKEVLELDPRLPQPKAAREPFIFSVAHPDLSVFKDKVSKWTRDKIMGAVNADEFPKELHKAYRDMKEVEAMKETDNGNNPKNKVLS